MVYEVHVGDKACKVEVNLDKDDLCAHLSRAARDLGCLPGGKYIVDREGWKDPAVVKL